MPLKKEDIITADINPEAQEAPQAESAPQGRDIQQDEVKQETVIIEPAGKPRVIAGICEFCGAGVDCIHA